MEEQRINVQNFYEYEKEVERLKVKINCQVDRLVELEEEKKQLNEKLQKLLEQQEMKLSDEQCRNVEYIRKWMYIVQKLYSDKKFIPYKNMTKNAKLYLRVKKNDIEEIIDSLFIDEQGRKQEFYVFLIKMQFFRYVDGKYKFYDCIDSKNVQVYMIRKDIVELSTGEKIEIEDD